MRVSLTKSRVSHDMLDRVLGASPDPSTWSTRLDTFARQALLRETAVASVLLGEPGPEQRAVLNEGGWRPLSEHRWGKLHPGFSGTPAVVGQRLSEVVRDHPEFTAVVQEFQQHLHSAASTPSLRQLDRNLWPTKVLHDDLANFVVPVGVGWVKRVFGTAVLRRPPPSGVGGPMDGLQMQFLQARPTSQLQPGTRLLWLQRPTGRGVTTRPVGCSVLQEVRLGTAAELLGAFGHLPGMNRSEVQALAGHPQALLTALVAHRAEVFTWEVTRVEALEVGLTLGGGRTLPRLPVRIDGRQFAHLYARGVGGEEGEENAGPEVAVPAGGH